MAPNNILNGNLLYMSMFTLDVAALSCFSGLWFWNNINKTSFK